MSKKNQKPTVIKPGKPAQEIDQESHVTKVQVLSDEQQDNTPIQPDTVIIDPKVESSIEEGPVLDEPLTEKEQKKKDDEYVDPADTLNPSKEAEFDEKHEKKLADVGAGVAEPTRYGAGKEKLADEIENPESRHYPPGLHGNTSGVKNEYPR